MIVTPLPEAWSKITAQIRVQKSNQLKIGLYHCRKVYYKWKSNVMTKRPAAGERYYSTAASCQFTEAYYE